MNKRDLIKAVAEKLGTTAAESEKSVTAVLDSMVESLKGGNNITIFGFGSFAVKERKERKGVNPVNRSSITIPSKKVIKFRSTILDEK
ncbi:MAG: HU family DNA-binding protein [Bacteroidales bacterium]